MTNYDVYPNWLKQRLIFKKCKEDGIPRLDHIEYPDQKCDDCNRTVKRPPRRVEYKLQLNDKAEHWRIKCANCKCWRDPFTGKFTMDQVEANSKYGKYATTLANNNQKNEQEDK